MNSSRVADQKQSGTANLRLRFGPIFTMKLAEIVPARVNDQIYRPIDPNAPDIAELAELIDKLGQTDELIITTDNVLISGHRRRAALLRLGRAEARVKRAKNVRSTDPNFPEILVACNQQREKNAAEKFREQLVLADPEDAYAELRRQQARVFVTKPGGSVITLGARKKRHRISNARRPFADAARKIVFEHEPYWPISVRKVHYSFLENPDPPPLNTREPGKKYENTRPCSQKLSNILTTMRLTGEVPMEAIDDDTRPVTIWDVHPGVGSFLTRETKEMYQGYFRDLQQTQPDHIELLAEKLTVQGQLRQVVSYYRIPMTIGRGYSSLPPRYAMVQRFRASGKPRMVVLCLGDFDPEGWNIHETYVRSLRDDFNINVVGVRVGLTREQIEGQKLPKVMLAKKNSSRYRQFVAAHGEYAWEIDALKTPYLQQITRDAIESVMDMSAFRAEQRLERDESGSLVTFRRFVQQRALETGLVDDLDLAD